MGYRHSLHILEKEKVDKLTSEEIKENESRYDLMRKLESKEILELGKYSDEGFELGKNGIKVKGILAEFRSSMYYEGDTEFEFIDPEKLVWLAEKYKERTVKYWNCLLGKDKFPKYCDEADKTVEENCKKYVENQLVWQKYILNTDKNNKFSIQDTWHYEYEMFNIIHCYKLIDWEKYYLVLIGG